MRRLILTSIVVIFAFALFAQDTANSAPQTPSSATMGNVLQNFYYADGGKLEKPLMDVAGKNPLPDSCLIEVALTKTRDKVDFWGDPHGTQLYNRWGAYYYIDHYTNSVEVGMPTGFFYTDYFIWLDPVNSSVEPAAHCKHPGTKTCDQIYIRLFNGPSIDKSTHYRTSPFIDAPLPNTDILETEITSWSPWTPIPKKP
jgi:hypothetical protein